MKILAVLLSFIVLSLSSLPCCGFETSEEVPSTEVHDVQNGDDCSENCSPFYTCGACAGFTVIDYTGEVISVFLKPVQHQSIYLSFRLPKTAASIWQPPKLS